MTVAAPEPQLARDFRFYLNTGTFAAPVWTRITGITGITPGQSSQKTDDTDFDTDGWEAGTVVQRGRSLSVALNYKENEDGDLDPGQEALFALGDAMGPDGKGDFKYLSPQGGLGHRFRGTVDMQWPGGDKTANASCTAEVTVDGKPTPLHEDPVPVIDAVTPANGLAAGGTDVEITGDLFDGATAVTFGGTPATAVVVVDDQTITCTTPPHAAGAVTVAVTTPEGTGSKATAFTYA